LVRLPSSHCSIPSVLLLPQLGAQSLSVFALAPFAGQHRSPLRGAVMVMCVHCTLQLAALPVLISVLQDSPSSQLVGQTALPVVSQVSPGSITPLPQLFEQSLSVLRVQPIGQQPSPPLHAVIGLTSQPAVHSGALPPVLTVRQALLLGHTGQRSGGSQVSPDSITLLPHLGMQSGSVVASAPEGQQPSCMPPIVMGIGAQTTAQPTP
jgi:hypothetical protein